MGCAKSNRPVSKRLRTTTTVVMYEPFTEWMPACGVDWVKMVLRLKSVQVASGSVFNVKPAIQVAEVRQDDPGTWAVIGNPTALDTNGDYCTGSLDISSTTTGQMYVRFGLAFYLSGGSPSAGQADLEMTLAYVQCGSIAGSATQQLTASNTTADAWAPVTGWILAMDAQKVVAAFSVSGLQNNFQYMLAYRKATANVNAPGAWTGLEQSWRTANGEDSTGELTLTLTDDMWVQLGVRYAQSSASASPGQATVTMTVATRRT